MTSHESAVQSSWKTGNTQGSAGGSGRVSGTGSAKSDNVDSLLGLAEKLRARSSNSTQGCLPELGAILGRGSFGKVYKGAPSSNNCLWVHDPPVLCTVSGGSRLTPAFATSMGVLHRLLNLGLLCV